jgi:hypothetical protein
MPQQRETYKGFEIVIEERPPSAGAATALPGATTPARTLTIGQKEIEIKEEAPGVFVTRYLPYTAYTSLMDLAKAVIEQTEEFRTP